MRSRRFGFLALAACLLLASPARAQFPVPPPDQPDPPEAGEPATPPPISLSYVDGRVDLVRPDGVQAAQAPDLLEEDDRLVTVEGRAELVLDDGSVVHVDRQSDLRIDLGVRLRLVSGRLLVHTPRDGEALVVATPAGPVRLAARGAYDLAAADLRGETVIAVREGHAALNAGGREIPIAADDVLHIDPRELQPRWTRGLPPDAFVDWSRRRLAASTATQYAALPPPVQPWAADLAANGQWSTMDPYGPVWFPAIGPSWRPYQYGSWRFTRYGWTWIDADRWAWPVHHYGRWGHHASRGWYWIPHRVWGPAWVGWAMAADHVAWSPLGWNRRPLVDFSVGVRLGPVGLFASSWSILPRHAFGRRGPIYRDLQDPGHLPGPVLGGFVSQMIGPRGPAGYGDRFAARPDRRNAPFTPRPSYRGGPPASPRPRPAAEAPREDRPVEVPYARRPMDAPAPRDPVSVPGVRVREWPSAPGAPSPADRARPPREADGIAPPGAPLRRPGVERAPGTTPPAPSGSRESAGPRRAPSSDGDGGAREARPRNGVERRAPQSESGAQGSGGSRGGDRTGSGGGTSGGQGGVRRRR